MLEPVQLAKFGVTELEAQHALDRLNVRDVDYADLYFESRTSESVSMEEGLVKRAAKSVSQGVGVRATAGEKTGFAYSDELTKKDLEIAADTARYIANSPKGDSPVPVPSQRRPTRNLYPIERAKAEVATADRVALLNEIDTEARRYDPRIKNVMASFNTEYKVLAVATSDGTSLQQEAVSLAKAKLGPAHPETLVAQANLAKCLLRQGNFTNAEAIARGCFNLYEETNPDHWRRFVAQTTLGMTLLAQKKYAEAQPQLTQAYDALKARERGIPASSRTCLGEAAQALAELYSARGELKAAARWNKELERLRSTPSSQPHTDNQRPNQ